MFIDSHCHLHMLKLDGYGGDVSGMVQAAEENGVEHILNVCVGLQELPDILALTERFPNITASVGVHPSEKMNEEPTVEQLVELAQHPKIIAIGESGLDYHYNDSGLDMMRERFRNHVRASKQTGKPVIVHSRDAREDTITILREEDATSAGGIMHCFTETWEMAQQALELGMYISFSGIVTFKNGVNVAEVAKKVPLENMLIETDAPYLAPIPYRGKQNEPQYVRFTAAKIAELKGITPEEVGQVTSDNFRRLFSMI